VLVSAERTSQSPESATTLKGRGGTWGEVTPRGKDSRGLRKHGGKSFQTWPEEGKGRSREWCKPLFRRNVSSSNGSSKGGGVDDGWEIRFAVGKGYSKV